MNTLLCRKLFVIHPLHFRNLYSTLASTNDYSQSLFSQFASTKFNMSAADINRMLKLAPCLQRLETLDKVKQFIDMLNRYGFSEVQIATIVRRMPSLIVTNAERILEPKIKLLEDFGFQGKTLTELLTCKPHILSIRLEKTLLPKMEFFQNLFHSKDLFIKTLLRSCYFFEYSLEKTLKPSVAFWEEWGFRGTELSRLVGIDPTILQRSSLTPAQVDLIKKIGVHKGSNAFGYIVSAVATSRMETLEAKMENLKLCGLSVEETWELCRAAPQIFTYSKEKVSETIKFVVNNMELPANYIVKHPGLFYKNVEKTMRPRFLVLQKIKSIDDPGLSLFTVMTMPEARFVRNIIGGHPEATTLRTIYENAISNAANHTKSSAEC